MKGKWCSFLIWCLHSCVISRLNLYCVVPENIHTPTTEGIGHSRGVGGQRPRKFRRGGGVRGEIHVQMEGNRLTHFIR